MITAFTVKNFKAIGDDPVRIELKPITLLFGANSVGKSSILHALQYADEVFNKHNPNVEVERTTLSENSLDLGSFERFVHRNDKNRSIVLRFDLEFKNKFNIPYDLLTRFSRIFTPSGYEDVYDLFPMLNPKKLLINVTTAYVEAEIAWSGNKQYPYVCRYETGLNGEPIAIICAEDYKKNTLRYFNISHPIFSDLIKKDCSIDAIIKACVKSEYYVYELTDKEQDNEHRTQETARYRRFNIFGQNFSLSSGTKNLKIDLLDQKDALPDLEYPLLFGKIYHDRDDVMRESFKTDWESYPEVELEISIVVFEDLLNSVLLAPGRLVAKWLTDICYLGPLREIPQRDFISNRSWRWEKGLAAWNLIYKMGQLQLDKTQKSHENISAWLKENFEKNDMEIWDSVLSDPKHKADFDKYLDDLPDAALFIKAQSKKSNEDIVTWQTENFEKYLNSLPADALVSLNLPRKSSSLREDADRRLYRINDWLASDQRLNTGYKVFIEQFREISSVIFKDFDEDKSQENVFVLLKKILNEPEIIRIWLHDISRSINLKPHEIGTGISQVLPVVVAAIGVDAPLVVIEQPELHIHPAMQVQLGDLFITQSNENKFFMIETHSEHLLLRILRRINETYENRLPPDIKPCTPDDVAIYYLEKESQGLRIRRLEISEDGDSKGDWPEGFFEERRAELF